MPDVEHCAQHGGANANHCEAARPVAPGFTAASQFHLAEGTYTDTTE
jgi:hypothetical protein